MRATLFACAFLLLGCPNKDDHKPVPELLDAPIASAIAVPSIAPPPPKAKLPCRAIAVTGKITNVGAGTPLAMGGTLTDGPLDLDEGSKMTVKDPESGRELSFDGPGRIRACVGGEPEFWLLKGGMFAVPSSGEAPGAEVWIATPNGILRFSSAIVKAQVEKDRVTVRVTSGAVGVFGPKSPRTAGPPPQPDGWAQSTQIAPIDLLAVGPPKPLVDACVAAAKEAHNLGAQVVQSDANLGDLAPKHVEARRKARTACMLARAAGNGDPALAARADAADAEWRVLERASDKRGVH